MRKSIVLLLLLAVTGCTGSEPPKLSAPGKDAQTWNLNLGRWTAADLRPRQGGN